MKLSEINKHGAKSYFEDRGLYRNPYPIGSPEFNEFERGWMQSLKRNNGILANEHSGFGSYYRNDNETLISRSPAELDAERYRSRKG